jgi:hypothetical protein
VTVSDEQMKEIIAELKKATALQAGAWLRVIDSARKCAQYELTGTYVDERTGSLVRESHGDRDSRLRMYQAELKMNIEAAFLEDVQVGKSVQETLR